MSFKRISCPRRQRSLGNDSSIQNRSNRRLGSKGASRISVVSANPDALAGVDSDRVATYQAASGKAMINLRKATKPTK